MERDPGIHIRFSKLILVLEDILDKSLYGKKDIRILAELIFDKGKGHSITSRSITITNDKLLKATTRISLSSRDDTSIFAHHLLLIRRKHKHKGLTIAKPGSSDWLQIKTIAKLANEFCNDFGLNKEKGYTKYIELGLKRMKRFGLTKFQQLHQGITEEYEAINLIECDLTPDLTIKAYEAYCKCVLERIGNLMVDYKNMPEKYVYFIKAKDAASRFNVPIMAYIKSQFDGMDWMNRIPDPLQLVGDKSHERLQSYLIKNPVINSGKLVPTMDFSKLSYGNKSRE